MDIREFIAICKKDKDMMIYFDHQYEIDTTVKPYFLPNNLPFKISEYLLSNDEPSFSLSINQGGTVYFNGTSGEDMSYLTSRFIKHKIFVKAKAKVDYMILSFSDNTKNIFTATKMKFEDFNLSDDKNAIKFYKFYTSNLDFDAFFFGDTEISAKDYCVKSLALLKAKGERKIINSLIERLENKPPKDNYKFLAELHEPGFLELLKTNYINDNGYQYPSKATKKIPLLEIKIKNLSNLPSLSDLEERIKSDKHTHASKLLISCYEANKNLSIDDLCENYDFIDNYISKLEEELRDIRYCLFLTDKVFKEFQDRSTQKELLYDDNEYSLIFNLPE